MCIAAPMQITEIDKENGRAKAVLNGNELYVDIRLVSPKIGDFVLVHAGCALEVVRRETAEELMSLFADIEELVADES